LEYRKQAANTKTLKRRIRANAMSDLRLQISAIYQSYAPIEISSQENIAISWDNLAFFDNNPVLNWIHQSQKKRQTVRMVEHYICILKMYLEQANPIFEKYLIKRLNIAESLITKQS